MMIEKIFSVTIIAYLTTLFLARPSWDVGNGVEALILFITALLIFVPKVVKCEAVPGEFRTLRFERFFCWPRRLCVRHPR